MNYNLYKPTSSISSGLSGLTSFEISNMDPNSFLHLGDHYLLAKYHISGRRGGNDNSGFGIFPQTDTADSNDVIIAPASNFANLLFDSIRVSINNVQLPSLNEYPLSSTINKIVNMGKSQNELYPGSNVFLLDEARRVPNGAGTAQKVAVKSKAQYAYSGFNKMLYQQLKSVFGSDIPVADDAINTYTRTIYVAFKIDAQLFNDETILPPMNKIKLDLLTNSQYHFSSIAYSSNGSQLAVGTPAINIVKSANVAETVDNLFNIAVSDLSLYIPKFIDNSVMNDAVLLNSKSLFVHTRNLQASTSDSFNITFPHPVNNIIVAFNDSRRGTTGHPNSYFGQLYNPNTTDTPGLGAFVTNSAHRQIRSCEIIYGAKTYPQTRYNINNVLDSREIEEAMRAYYDFIHMTGQAHQKAGGIMTFPQWRCNPMFAYKPDNVTEINCVVNLNFNNPIGANNTCVVTGYYDETIELKYDERGMLESTAVLA
jgi:hypothetical protein